MDERIDRRSLLKATGGLAATIGGIGSVSTAAAGGQAVDLSSPAGIEVTITQYDGASGRNGALPEDLTAFDSGRLRLADFHTFLWDGDWEIMQNVRDDAVSSSVSKTDGVPEVTVENRLEFVGQNKFTVRNSYAVDISQDIVLARDRPALLTNTKVDYESLGGGSYDLGHTHSAYHLLNPEIDDYDSGGAGDEAWVENYNGYDVIGMKDGQWHAVFAREHTRPQLGRGLEQLDKDFEGHRVGVEGVESGPNKSAWNDVETEADGWIDSNDYNSGDIDAVAGTYLHDDSFHFWDTAIGFGTSYEEAANAATSALYEGYGPISNQY